MKAICILKLFIVHTWLKFHILLSFQIKKKKKKKLLIMV